MTPPASPLRAAVRATLRSQYFWACCVYFCYATGMLSIDYCPWPDETVSGVVVGDPRCAAGAADASFLRWGVVHLLNAAQFLASWRQSGRRLDDAVTSPDWANILGALLYLRSASLYPRVTLGDAPAAALCHRLELAASLIEFFASIGWVAVWWVLREKHDPSRGVTLVDPDFTANVFIVVPSIVYVVYNIQTTLHPGAYGTNTLYKWGDVLYWLGSVFYLLASLRDAGWMASLAGPFLEPTGAESRDVESDVELMPAGLPKSDAPCGEAVANGAAAKGDERVALLATATCGADAGEQAQVARLGRTSAHDA